MEKKDVIYSEFLNNQEDGGLYVAKIDSAAIIDQEHSAAQAYTGLRTRIYRKYGFLDPNIELDIDVDDERSDHYIAMVASGGDAALPLGVMRLINKNQKDEMSLPIENYFDDALNTVVDKDAAEISRLAIEKNGFRAGVVRTRLIQTALKTVMANGTTQTLAMVDSWFRDYLRDKAFIPMTQVAKEQQIAKYPEIQVGIDVDFETLERNIGVKALDLVHQEEGLEFYRF